MSPRLIALLTPAIALGTAYASQYWGGLSPCEMCWWQRYAHFAALGLAFVGFALPKTRWPLLLAALAIATSAGIGALHAGVEYGWWEGFTRCTTQVQFGQGHSALEAIMGAPAVRCDEVQWKLLGISLAGYNFLFSGASALLILVTMGRKK
ncbi:MAG: hypothetical protein RLY97_422 [Pseudomonadota bacterium]|jgi:disulfide bond formation protein DsbB